jgi:hypothetical protein
MGSQAYLIRLLPPEQDFSQPHTAEASAITDILSDFADIFEEPIGLPPSRACDHTIPIQEGSRPPNVRPYRMPHKQKNIVEYWWRGDE